MNKKNIMILGNFSGNNAGDTAVLDSIIDYIEKKFSNVKLYIPTTSTVFINKRYTKIRSSIRIIPIDIRKRKLQLRFIGFRTIFSLINLDYIFTTAGILFDRRLYKIYYNFIITINPLLAIAKFFKVKVIGLCVGITSPTTIKGGAILKKVIEKHDYIIVRDDQSKRIGENISSKISFTVGSDIALKKIIKDKKSSSIVEIGFNITEYLSSLIKDKNINLIDLIDQSIRNIDLYIGIDKLIMIKIFVTAKMDIEISKLLYAKLSKSYKVELVNLYQNNSEELYKNFSNLNLFIGTRMHSIIFALSNEIPSIGLNYNEKVKGFFSLMNIEEYIIELHHLSKHILVNKMILALNEYDKYKRKIHLRLDYLVTKRLKILDEIFELNENEQIT